MGTPYHVHTTTATATATALTLNISPYPCHYYTSLHPHLYSVPSHVPPSMSPHPLTSIPLSMGPSPLSVTPRSSPSYPLPLPPPPNPRPTRHLITNNADGTATFTSFLELTISHAFPVLVTVRAVWHACWCGCWCGTVVRDSDRGAD